MDIRHLPGVRGVDVVGAGRRRAHQVAHRPQHHVVAGPRPRLVGDQLHVAVKRGVVEEVQRLPALARRDLERSQRAVEVVGAVDVPGVAEVLVVLGLAGERERVVAADGVAHHLDQRVHVEVVELAVQAGLGVGVAHQRSGHGGVEAALDAAFELGPVEGEEVRALLALDVDDLDVLAGPRPRSSSAEAGSIRKSSRGSASGGGSSSSSARAGGPAGPRPAARWPGESPSITRPPGRGDDQRRLALGGERHARCPAPSRARTAARSGPRAGPARGRPARREPVGAPRLRSTVASASWARPERRPERRDLRHLAAVAVDDPHSVVAGSSINGRPARPNRVGLERRVARQQSADQQRRRRAGERRHRAPTPTPAPTPCRPRPAAPRRACACRRRRAS